MDRKIENARGYEAYAKLSAQCSEAAAEGNKPAVAKLMKEKQKAFAACYSEIASEKRARRDALKKAFTGPDGVLRVTQT